MERDKQSNARAAQQMGLLTSEDVRASGLDYNAVSRRKQGGTLYPVQPRVHRVAGAPVTLEQQLLAACKSTGGVASHRAAAALWGLDVPAGTLEVSVTRPRCPRPKGVLLHRSKDLRPEDVTVRFGIPVTNPLRTLLDLGAVLPPWLVDSAINTALAKKLVTLPGLEVTLLTHSKKGRRGAGVLRRLLDERGGLVPESELEGRMHRLCRRHGLPLPQFQYVIRKGRRFIARVDFAFPERMIAIEVDGYRDHSSPEAFQHDRSRQNDVVELGWVVLRFTWDDIVRRPEAVASRLLRVLGAVSPA